MAEQRIEIVRYTDDLTGDELAEGDHERIRFTFDGKPRVIDLSADNAQAFRDDLARWMDASRPDGRKRATTSRPKRDTATIRAWAQDNGYDVSDRGRIPAHVEDAFDSAQ